MSLALTFFSMSRNLSSVRPMVFLAVRVVPPLELRLEPRFVVFFFVNL